MAGKFRFVKKYTYYLSSLLHKLRKCLVWELNEDSSRIQIISPSEDWVLNAAASLKEEMVQGCNSTCNLISQPSLTESPTRWLKTS